MMGDSSMGEAPEDLYHHMQVLSCENEQGGMARGLTFLESGLMTLVPGFRTHLSIASQTAFFLHTTPS